MLADAEGSRDELDAQIKQLKDASENKISQYKKLLQDKEKEIDDYMSENAGKESDLEVVYKQVCVVLNFFILLLIYVQISCKITNLNF